MEKMIYQGEYPNELKRKWQLYEKGLKPTGESVAIFLNEKGKKIELFQEAFAIPLTLEDGNRELCFWRDGLKKEEHPNWVLIKQLENQIKSRILKNESDKKCLTEKNLFFKDEYPTDELIKTEDLKRLGFKPKHPVAAYIGGETSTPLYRLKDAEPLTIQTATPGEKKRWIEGLERGLVQNLSEEERQALIEDIRRSLEKTQTKKKTQPNETKPKKETTSIKKSSLKTKKTTKDLNTKGVEKLTSKTLKKRESHQQKEDDKKERPKTIIVEAIKGLKEFGEQIPHLSFSTLKKDVIANSEAYLFLNIVGTGVFFQDELLELSLIDGKGNLVYHQHFLPNFWLSKPRNLPHQAVQRVFFTDESSNIRSLIETKTLLIYNPNYVLPLLKRTFEKYKDSFPMIRWIDLTMPFKSEWGVSSLETGSHHLSWKVDKSILVYDALMSGYVCLSLLKLSDEWLTKQEQARIVFETYCSLRTNPTEARVKGWEWLRNELKLHTPISSLQSLGLNQCEVVIRKLQPFILSIR